MQYPSLVYFEMIFSYFTVDTLLPSVPFQTLSNLLVTKFVKTFPVRVYVRLSLEVQSESLLIPILRFLIKHGV